MYAAGFASVLASVLRPINIVQYIPIHVLHVLLCCKILPSSNLRYVDVTLSRELSYPTSFLVSLSLRAPGPDVRGGKKEGEMVVALKE